MEATLSGRRRETQEVRGAYPRLAEVVRGAIGTMSTRDAGNRARIGHNTIAQMLRGMRANEMNTLRFAEAFGLDPVALLTDSGYAPEAALHRYRHSAEREDEGAAPSGVGMPEKAVVQPGVPVELVSHLGQPGRVIVPDEEDLVALEAWWDGRQSRKKG
jgi:hypothetical protein